MWLFLLVLACGGAAATSVSAPAGSDPSLDVVGPTGLMTAPTGDSGRPGDPCANELTAPVAPVRPQPGELYYAQLGLGGVFLGESAVVVGPDGTVVLIDAGNDAHDDDVQRFLAELAVQMEAAGFPDVDGGRVDHVLITHLHADHADGLEDLLEDVSVDGVVVHRGFVDLTEAANSATVAQLCRAVQGQVQVALCEGPPLPSCDQASWSGSYAATGCEGLEGGDLTQPGDAGPAHLPLGEGAELSIVAANGHMAGASFAEEIGPLRADDLNGENARSLVGVLSHGPFRLLFAGDLTAGTSDSDPVEEFFVPRFDEVGDLDARGVDVLHLSHHGRDSSSSVAWLDRLLPADGRVRHGVVGVSTAHVGSPHASVLEGVLGGGRLGGGALWTTTVAPGGATASGLVSAEGGRVLLSTVDGGRAYAVQAVGPGGAVLASEGTHAVRTCR